MRIALICTEKLPVPPVAGGAVQLYIEGIVPYLSRYHDLTVFGIEYRGLPQEEVRGTVKYIRVPAPSKNAYIANVKAHLRGNFDLIYVFNRPLWVLFLANSLSGVRFGLSLHNEMFHPEKINDAKALQCVERVDFINNVSRFIADGVKKRVPLAENKLRVIYSGADFNKYAPAWTVEAQENKLRLKKKYDIQDYRVVLFVGRLSNKKGVDVLLKAMQRVTSYHRDVALVIVGSKWYGKNESDEYTTSLQLLARSVKGPIVFTGFLSPSQIPPHYNMADVFVCASQWNEPLARVHYEAMAAGLPIVTTDRGGNAEVVEDGINGIILDSSTRSYSNPDAMADRIHYLLDHPKVASELGKNGRKLVEEKYNWERVAQEVLQSITGSHYPSLPPPDPVPDTPDIVDSRQEPEEKAPEKESSSFFDVDF